MLKLFSKKKATAKSEATQQQIAQSNSTSTQSSKSQATETKRSSSRKPKKSELEKISALAAQQYEEEKKRILQEKAILAHADTPEWLEEIYKLQMSIKKLLDENDKIMQSLSNEPKQMKEKTSSAHKENIQTLFEIGAISNPPTPVTSNSDINIFDHAENDNGPKRKNSF